MGDFGLSSIFRCREVRHDKSKASPIQSAQAAIGAEATKGCPGAHHGGGGGDLVESVLPTLWAKILQQFHPPESIKPLPSGHSQALPRIQADSSHFIQSQTTETRRTEVRNAFIKSYNSYRQHAWMMDELTPLTGKGKNTFGGWAATLVDSLDTLWIMGLKEEFDEATAALVALDWAKTDDGAANLFETTIRHLGGLLGAYELSGQKALLKKAHELGEMLYVAFDTPNRLPGFWINFKDAIEGNQVAGVHDPSASPSSLCLEFTRLSQLTGDPKFYDATDRVTRFLERVQNDTLLPGMWPREINFQKEKVDDTSFTLGALADSLYEYLPKMHALLGGRDDTYENLYRNAMETIIKHLLFKPMLPDETDILFTGELHIEVENFKRHDFVPESQHLTCFVGGMFAIGGKLFNIPEHVDIAERLTKGCGWAYSQFPTGLMPEIFSLVSCETRKLCDWDDKKWQREGDPRLAKGFKNARDPRYQLRPEAIESIFIMYRITGDKKWQEMAWDMFQSIMKATATEYGNAAIEDVTVQGETTKIDSMESFWLSETLKYFYLIFSPPDLVSLDEYVLNTEAHPLRRT
ncbi:Fc.00g009600.m01.CDS01 [Cosmosporella sp. VM-42]